MINLNIDSIVYKVVGTPITEDVDIEHFGYQGGEILSLSKDRNDKNSIIIDVLFTNADGSPYEEKVRVDRTLYSPKKKSGEIYFDEEDLLKTMKFLNKRSNDKIAKAAEKIAKINAMWQNKTSVSKSSTLNAGTQITINDQDSTDSDRVTIKATKNSVTIDEEN